MKKSRYLYFLVTTIIGLIVLIPQLRYQPFLLQGDHGRDLYLFQQVAHGASPYRDIATDNGPLMPYYYAIFLSLFGDSVQSVLLGYAILILLAGLMIFLIARRSVSETWALIGALWYWAWRGQEFFYTFNHIGAVVLGLIVLYFTLCAIETPQRRYIICAMIGSIICVLIRPDIGLASAAASVICYALFCHDSGRSRLWPAAGLLGILGISLGAIRFSCPELLQLYQHEAHLDYLTSNLILFIRERWIFLTQNLLMMGISGLMALLVMTGVVSLIRSRNTMITQKRIRHLGCALIFIGFFFMEYLSGTRFFRWIWIMPMVFLVMIYGVASSFSMISAWIRRLCAGVIVGVCLVMIALNYADALTSKQDGVILDIGETRVALAPARKDWIQTVESASDVIKYWTRDGDSILAIPYDALYCFLTGRRLAVKNPVLFLADSRSVIESIQSQEVKVILISNRAFHHNEQDRFGIFGKDYGIELWRYIQTNYDLTTQIGPWAKTPSALDHHAVQIYVRNPITRKTPIHPGTTPESANTVEGIRKNLKQN